MSMPLHEDIYRRELRERTQRNAQHCTVCAETSERYRCGDVLFPLAPSSGIAARPVRMVTKYEGSCAKCFAPIAPGNFVWWAQGTQGIECDGCGGSR
jgi:hypothetical protein